MFAAKKPTENAFVKELFAMISNTEACLAGIHLKDGVLFIHIKASSTAKKCTKILAQDLVEIKEKIVLMDNNKHALYIIDRAIYSYNLHKNHRSAPVLQMR
jgi:hypothetical protein